MSDKGTTGQDKDRLPKKTVELSVEDILTQIGIPRENWLPEMCMKKGSDE